MVIPRTGGEAYIHQRTEWMLFRAMACRLIGPKQLPEPMVPTYHELHSCKHFKRNLNQNTLTFFHKNACENVDVKYRPFLFGLSMPNDCILHWPCDWSNYRCKIYNANRAMYQLTGIDVVPLVPITPLTSLKHFLWTIMPFIPLIVDSYPH